MFKRIISFFLLSASAAMAAYTPPASPTNSIQYNNAGKFGGVAPVDGQCLGSSGGIPVYTSCSGSSSVNLGASTSVTSPHITGDITSGLYTAGAGKVDLAISGNKQLEVASGVATFSANSIFNNGITNNYTGGATVPLNKYSGIFTVTDPVVEVRPQQSTLTCKASSADNTQACLPSISIGYIDPGIKTYGNSSGGSIDSPGYYGFGAMNSSVVWHSGCTVGVDCPGSAFYAAGVEGYVSHATGTDGELVNGNSFIIHGISSLHQGQEKDTVTGLYDNSGCNSGTTAAMCYGVAMGSLYNGFGTFTPMADLHARGGDATASANVYISGTTLCLASYVSPRLFPYAVVTGAGITANTHILTAARADVPNGNICYTVDQSQTVGTASSPVAATITSAWTGFLAQNFSAGATSEAGYNFQIASGSIAAPDARIGLRYDTTVPLAKYLAINLGGTDELYGITPGGARVGGIAIGYPNINAFPLSYQLTVATAMNVDGVYSVNRHPGVNCNGNVITENGITTACGGGRTPSTNVVTFTMLGKASAAILAAGNTGGTGYLVNDTITVTGGTCSVYPVLKVATVSVTSVATLTIQTAGSCTVLPTAPTAQGTTSGIGTGATFQVTWIPLTQTYTPTAGMATLDVYACGAGGSGGGGASQAASTAASGGAGGGGASCIPATVTATQVGASVIVSVGVPSLQGAPATTNTTAGGNGGAAGNNQSTTFGSLVTGWGGGSGAGGQLAATSGGGGGGGFTTGISSTGITGGATGAINNAPGGTGTAGGVPTNQLVGSGGAGSTAAGVQTNGTSSAAGASGATGGGLTAGGVANAGGNGGPEFAAGRNLAAPTGGAANTDGSNGNEQTTPQFGQACGTGASGGGAALTGTAGKGGNGATCSGAAGGGDAVNGATPGWGGLGGPGILTMIERF